MADPSPLLRKPLFLPPRHDTRPECVVVPHGHSLLHDAAIRIDSFLPQRLADFRHHFVGKRSVPGPCWAEVGLNAKRDIGGGHADTPVRMATSSSSPLLTSPDSTVAN